jgi:ubiquinone/menaquinone biosynthesis C-methylase UbiE
MIHLDIDEEVKPEVVADATCLPFKDGSIEGVYMGQVLIEVCVWSHALIASEIIRVCKVGARILVHEYGDVSHSLAQEQPVFCGCMECCAFLIREELINYDAQDPWGDPCATTRIVAYQKR